MKIVSFLFILFLLFPTTSFARSGCCSYHGGVRADGCGCNDGTSLSSTCAPYYQCSYSAPIQKYNTPTSIPVTNTPIPTSTPVPPTATAYPTNSIAPTSNSHNTTQEVEGISTKSNDSSSSIVLVTLLLSGLIGGIYYKNKRNKGKAIS